MRAGSRGMRLSIASYSPCRASTHPRAQPSCRQGRPGSCTQTGSSGCQYGGLPECLYFITVKHSPAKFFKSWVQSREWSLSTGRRMQDGHRHTGKARTSWVPTWQEEIQEIPVSTMENDCLPLNDRLQISFNISTTYGYTANVISTQPGASVCIFGTSSWKLSFLLAVGFTGLCWWVTLALHTKDLVRNHMPGFIK